MGDYVYAFGSFWCSVGDGFGDGVEPDAGGLRGWRRYQQHPDPALDTKPGAYPNADAYTDTDTYSNAYTDTDTDTYSNAYSNADAYTDSDTHTDAVSDDCDWKADHQRQFHRCCQCFRGRL